MNRVFDLPLAKEAMTEEAFWQYQLSPNVAGARTILLGDSRMDNFLASDVEKITGERYFNLAYGGGTVREMIDTFWFAASVIPLKNVYIETSLININAFQNKNQFPESQAIRDNPLLYLINRTVMKAAYYSLLSQLRGKAINVETQNLEREAFWKQQLGVPISGQYGHYKYSTEYYEGLQEIARYCDAHGIALTFVIPPTHVDLQAKIEQFGLTGQAEQFRKDLRRLGKVVDLDLPNAFTRNRENFSDPFHIRPSVVVEEAIWGRQANPEISN